MRATTRSDRNRRAALALLCGVALTAATLPRGAQAQPAPSTGTAGSVQAPGAPTAAPSAVPNPLVVTQTATGLAVENLTFSLPSVTYRIPRAELRGNTLSPAEISALLDPGSSVPVLERLTRLEASEILLPQVSAEQTVGGIRQETTYRDVRLTGIKDGRVASVVSGGGAFDSSGPAGASRGTFSQMDLTDIDLALAVALYAGTGRAEPDPPKRLYGSFSLEGMKVEDPSGATTGIARLASGEILARVTGPGLGATAQALSALSPDLGRTDVTVRRQIYGLVGDMIAMFDIRSLEATGFTFSDRRNAANTGRIARLAFTGASENRPTEIRLEGLDVVSETGKVRIGSVAVGGLSLTPLLDAARGLAETGPDGTPDPAKLRKLFPSTGSLRVSDIAFEQVGPGPAADSPGSFAIGTVEITADKPVDDLPSELRFGLRDIGFAVPAAEDAGALKDLAQLGYKRVDASLGIAARWDESRQEILLRDFSLRSPTMGDIAMSGVIGNVSRDAFNPDSAIALVALASAKAKSLDITVDNRGLYERILERQAKRERRSTEDLRREYGVAAAIGVPAMLGNSASARALGAALARFAAKPGTLAIQARAKNEAGLGLVDLTGSPDPTALLERLEIKASAQ
jgi:hypothetical protein